MLVADSSSIFSSGYLSPDIILLHPKARIRVTALACAFSRSFYSHIQSCYSILIFFQLKRPSIDMSDRYRPPPSGPKGNRNYNRNDPKFRSTEKFPPSGPKRYHERDNYRPSGPNHNGSSAASTPNPKPSHKGNNNHGGGPPGGPKGGQKPGGFKNGPRGNNPPPGPSNSVKRSSSYVNPKFNASKKQKFNKSGKPFDKNRPFPPIPTKLEKYQIYLIKTVRPVEIYQRSQQVGEGTYGKVYKAKNEITDEFVALKKLRLETEREGFPITAIREIKLLQSFDHKNVISLLEMMVEHNQIFMIFDYMEHDLTGLLTHPELNLSESHRKFIFKQLMEGLNYLHRKRVIHRDIKGSNILLDNIGRLKIADFGLARTMKILKDGESPDYTNRVITIWYRPPELLLGSTDYGREIDIWGVGCLLIELYSRLAAFRGFDEVGQLQKIYNIMGTPTLDEWPEIQNLPWFEMLKPKVNKIKCFNQRYKNIMSEQAFDLAENLLQLNPKKRFTASQALSHDYFTKDPKPEPLFFLKDVQGEWHEFETKKRRRKERKRIQDEQDRLKAQGTSTQVEAATEQANNGNLRQSVPLGESEPGVDNSKPSEELEMANTNNSGHDDDTITGGDMAVPPSAPPAEIQEE